MMDLDKRRKLINLIKDHAVLFNTSLPEYKDTATRSDAWGQIAAEMDMTGTYLYIHFYYP